MREEFIPEDIHLFTGKRHKVIVECCDQVPVLGFKCGRYDLNLIKEHLDLLADTTGKVQVGKNVNMTVFIKTNGFYFLDVINYLGPGISYKR